MTINFGGNLTTTCNLTFTTSALPAGATAAFTPSAVAGANNNTPKTTSLAISTTTGVAAGTYTFTVTAVAGGGCQGGNATSTNVTLTVQNTTNLSVTPITAVYGQTVNLSATLTSGSPAVSESGQTINFTLNGSAAGSATTNASGTASRTASLGTIAAGTYPTGVGASFTTNGPILGSTGSAQLTVSPANTTTTVGNSSGTSGGSANLTANVTANSPSTATVNEGTVTFTVKQGATTIGTVTSGTVAGGAASASFSLIGVVSGTYSINATYNPAATPNFNTSTAATAGTLTVNNPVPTTTSISPTSKNVGDATLHADRERHQLREQFGSEFQRLAAHYKLCQRDPGDRFHPSQRLDHGGDNQHHGHEFGPGRRHLQRADVYCQQPGPHDHQHFAFNQDGGRCWVHPDGQRYEFRQHLHCELQRLGANHNVCHRNASDGGHHSRGVANAGSYPVTVTNPAPVAALPTLRR